MRAWTNWLCDCCVDSWGELKALFREELAARSERGHGLNLSHSSLQTQLHIYLQRKYQGKLNLTVDALESETSAIFYNLWQAVDHDERWDSAHGVYEPQPVDTSQVLMLILILVVRQC